LPGARQHLDEVDLRILEVLDKLSRPARPKLIAEEAGLDVRRVAAKMRKLRRLGLVERVGEGEYVITDRGREVLQEQVALPA